MGYLEYLKEAWRNKYPGEPTSPSIIDVGEGVVKTIKGLGIFAIVTLGLLAVIVVADTVGDVLD